jgi:hypothetical protein
MAAAPASAGSMLPASSETMIHPGMDFMAASFNEFNNDMI